MNIDAIHREMERVLDGAEFARRALHLYESVRSSMTRELLLGELKHRLSPFNGRSESKPFKPHLFGTGPAS